MAFSFRRRQRESAATPTAGPNPQQFRTKYLDFAGLAAARNERTYLIQSYPRAAVLRTPMLRIGYGAIRG